MTLGLAKFQVCKVLEMGYEPCSLFPVPHLFSLPSRPPPMISGPLTAPSLIPTCITPKLLLPAGLLTSSCRLPSYHSWLQQGTADSFPAHPETSHLSASPRLLHYLLRPSLLNIFNLYFYARGCSVYMYICVKHHMHTVTTEARRDCFWIPRYWSHRQL